MSTLKKVVIWTACKNAWGEPDMVKTTVEVSDGDFDLGIHYDLAEAQLTDNRREGPFVHFDEKEMRPLIEMAGDIRAIKPVVINNNVDQYPELADNPDDLPVSLRDYDCANSEITDEGLKKFKENYEDAARQDERGHWYVERGNVPVQAEESQQNDEESTGMTL